MATDRNYEIITAIDAEYCRRESVGLDIAGFSIVGFLMARFGLLAATEIDAIAVFLRANAEGELRKSEALLRYRDERYP